MQECCTDAASALAAALERRVAELPAAAPGAEGARVVEQALLLGAHTAQTLNMWRRKGCACTFALVHIQTTPSAHPMSGQYQQ